MIYHPIVVLGAGPAGCTAALALSKRGQKAFLVDQSTFPRDKVCGDALSGKVLLTLKRIDSQLVDGLSAEPAVLGSHGVIFYAPNGKALKVPFRREADLTNPPGYIMRRMDFDNWLFEKAASAPGITAHTGCRIEKFRREGNQWILSNSDGSTVIRTDLVIAADGAHSRFSREIGGIQKEDEHYCAAIRGYYKGVKDLDPQGFIELHFLKDFLPGYFWIFPMANGYANVGAGMRSDVVGKKRVNLKTTMDRILREYEPFRKRFEDAEPDGEIRGYGLPLGS